MKRASLLLSLVAILCLAGCAPSSNECAGIASSDGTLAGFWLGFWHGLISPITFLISLFNSEVGVYEVHNTGGWYNFGFLLGAGSSLGGSRSASRSSGRKE